jgi:TldD protein
MNDYCLHAIDSAQKNGCTYADARILSINSQGIGVEDQRVTHINTNETCGIGIRVLKNNAWGFAATSQLTNEAIDQTVKRAVQIANAGSSLSNPNGIIWAKEDKYVEKYQTPFVIDPFKVALSQKIDLLLAISKEALSVKGASKCHGSMFFKRQQKWIATTEGTLIETDCMTSHARYNVTAVGSNDAKTRYFEASAANAGYEHIENTPLLAEATRVANEAVAQLTAKPCVSGAYDLILNPTHLALTMHESIGHATELDRVLGMEESLAGSSFATIDKLNTLQYGSPMMNIICDNTMPLGLATMGFDDDCVKGQQWDLIKDGVLIDYQTDRETCHAINAERSRGCSRATSWSDIPICRMSNFGLSPNANPLTPEELISDTKNGILIDGMGSFSIDQKRQNFQFGGDCFWEVKNGKITGMLKDVTYQAITTDFWGSLDAICDKRFWEPVGVMNCGKGDPMQIAQMSHAAAPARFKGISVGGAS